MNLQDVLNLQEPERYWCELWRFTVGHTELHIQITKDHKFNDHTKVFYLLFAATERISGPTKWQGAKLRHGTVEEYFEYWSIIHPGLASTVAETQEVLKVISNSEHYSHRLHIFETPIGKMEIYSAPPWVLSYEEYYQFDDRH